MPQQKPSRRFSEWWAFPYRRTASPSHMGGNASQELFPKYGRCRTLGQIIFVISENRVEWFTFTFVLLPCTFTLIHPHIVSGRAGDRTLSSVGQAVQSGISKWQVHQLTWGTGDLGPRTWTCDKWIASRVHSKPFLGIWDPGIGDSDRGDLITCANSEFECHH